MVLKLYGSPQSPPTLLVALVLHEKQVPFEFVLIDFPNREHKSAEYLAKNPFGQVPCIDDDGFILYESKAIAYYIASKYPNQGTPLLPTGLKANALFQQAVFVETNHFEEHAMQGGREIYFKQKQGLTPDQGIVDKHVADLSSKMDVYDKILSKQKYLVGDEITLADLYHIPVGSLLPGLGINVIESKPNVARWFKDISSRASWKTVQDTFKSNN